MCDIERKLNEWIRLFKCTLKGHQTLFIIDDDCSAEGEINKKQDALSELAISGRHRNHSLWVLMQKYNSVSKDVRKQIKWLCLFFTKDRNSFEDCFRENDVIPDKSERDRLKNAILKAYLEMLSAYWLSFVFQLVNICYKFVDQLVI